MSSEIIREIIKLKNKIREKHRAIRNQRTERDSYLEGMFKPITGPLKELAMIAKLEPQDNTKLESKKEDFSEMTMTPLKRKYLKMEPTTSTPSTSRKFRSLGDDNDEDDDDDDDEGESQFATPTHSLILERAASLPDIPSSSKLIDPYLALHINKSTKVDKTYGIYFDGVNWKIGNSVVTFGENNIVVKGKTYNITEGLLELLFMKKPQKTLFNDEDLMYYGTILKDTSAYKRNYDEDGRIKGSRGYKYKNIVSKFLKHTGSGLTQSPRKKIEYIYWNDPKELANRLEYLMTTQRTIDHNQRMEIVSIIEELKQI